MLFRHLFSNHLLPVSVFCMISTAILEIVLFVFLYHRASFAIAYIDFLFCMFLKNFFGNHLHRFSVFHTLSKAFLAITYFVFLSFTVFLQPVLQLFNFFYYTFCCLFSCMLLHVLS